MAKNSSVSASAARSTALAPPLRGRAEEGETANTDAGKSVVWRLELLGGLRARRLDAPTAAPIERFRTQKTASLLAFLALERRAHRRETLCEMFWPEAEPDSQRNSLRVALSALRSLLEPPEVAAGSALQISRDAVALGAGVETDVALFQAALKRANQSDAASDSDSDSTRREALEAAVALYRGPLLRGQPCEWLMGAEGRLEDSFIAALRALCEQLEAEDQGLPALDVARGALLAAPAREEAMREVLRLGLHHGQVTQTAREWKAWQKRAVRDGISVDETTLALARALTRALQKSPLSNLVSHLAGADAAFSTPTAFAEPVTARGVEKFAAGRGAILPPPVAAMPAQWTTFFGRSCDLETLQAWLEQAPTQLVTITGPGGGGKTRLALEVTRRLAHGDASAPVFGAVEWFSLADLPLAHLLPGAILDGLRVPRGDASPATLAAALRQRIQAQNGSRLLLVLDNFEHLCDEGGPLVHQLLEAVPELSCLVTSRQRLGFAGEREWPLQPLEIPPAAALRADSRPADALRRDALRRDAVRFEALMATPSVQLFLDRARLARPGFSVDASSLETVARLCARLDGLPLALELAAARITLFSPAQILSGLDRQNEPELPLAAPRSRPTPGIVPGLTANASAAGASAAGASAAGASAAGASLDWENHDRAAPARHRSLRAAIAWSERELPRQTAQFWSRLSVFRGGWTLDAAAFVCEAPDAASLMLALRDVSLLSLDTRGESPRGHQLAALREYASEALEAREKHHLEARHAQFFLEWAEAVKPHLDGPQATYYLSRLEVERNNLRAAYCWLLEHDVEGALRLGAALYWSWELRGRVEEGRIALWRTLEAACTSFPDVIERAADFPADRSRLHLLARVQNGAGKLATVACDMAAARGHLEAALGLFQILGDDLGAAECLYSLGYMHLKSGDVEQAHDLCDQSVAIYRRAGDTAALCDALYNRALVAIYECDFGTARVINIERLTIHRAAGEQRGVAISLESLGFAALFGGEVEAARAYFSESLSIFEAMGEWGSVARVLWGLGHAARAAGEPEAARPAFTRALCLARDSQALWTLPYILEGLAHLAADSLVPTIRAAETANGETANGETANGETANGASDNSAADNRGAARAVRLLGAASLLRETHDEPLPNPAFRQELDAAVMALRALLGPSHFDSEWQLGRSLSPVALMDFALKPE